MIEATAAPGRSGLKPTTLILLGSFAALGPLSLDIYLPAVTPMSADLRAGPEEATASLSIFFIGMAIGQLFIGPWSDRVGRRLPLLSGLATAALGAIICMIAPNIAALLFGRLLQALGGAAVMVTGRAAIRDHLDERGAASFFSTTSAINSLAPMLAPSVGAAILLLMGWRGIFGMVAVLALLLLAGTTTNLPESHRPAADRPVVHPLRVYRLLLTNPGFLGFLLAAAANGAAYFTYMALSPLVLMQVYGLSPSAYALILAINGCALILSTQVNRRLLRIRTPRQILGYAAWAALALVAPLLFWAWTGLGGLPVLVAMVFVVMVSGGFVQANSMAAGLSLEPMHIGSAAALFGAALFGSGTIVSMIGGLLFDGTARPLVLLIAAAMLAMTLSLKLLALRAA